MRRQRQQQLPTGEMIERGEAPPILEDILPAMRAWSEDEKVIISQMSPREVSLLTENYYVQQKNRIRASNQKMQLEKAGEPAQMITLLYKQAVNAEKRIMQALDIYTDVNPNGIWAKSLVGVGPVISAGLISHLNVCKAPTAGHFWRFAGMDKKVIWCSADDASEWLGNQEITMETVFRAADHFGRNREGLLYLASFSAKGEAISLTKKSLASALARIPYNNNLKTLCWKFADCAVKFSGREDCFYGQRYLMRKASEAIRNENGGFAEQAAKELASKNYGKGTQAYQAYIQGKLPPGHLHARALCATITLFLSHLHEVMFWNQFHELPPNPFCLAHMEHTHYIEVPNLEFVPGLKEAKEKARRLAS